VIMTRFTGLARREAAGQRYRPAGQRAPHVMLGRRAAG